MVWGFWAFRRRIECDMRLSFGQLILLIICLLSALLLDFYLGARFGPEMLWGISLDRGSADSLLPDDVSEQELNSLLQEGPSKVTFHEVLEGKKGEEEARKEETKKEETKKIDTKKAEPKKEEPKKETKKIITVAPVPASKPIPVSVSPLKEMGAYTLQIGSFGDADQAQALKEQFQSRGYSVNIREKNILDKGTWYHVTAGRFSSSDEAEKKKEEIYQKYHTLPIVVKLSQ